MTVASWRNALASYQTPAMIPLFGTSLRSVGPEGIPVAAPDSFPAPVTGGTHYTIDVRNFADPGVCPTLGPTGLWGYHPTRPLGGGMQPQRHLGGIIVAQRGTPLQITFRNRLNVLQHLLPNDPTIMGADGAVDRVAVHLHGGMVPWLSDGGPHAWFDPRGNRGASFINNQLLNPQAAPNEAEYYYPNNQSARMMWYHDHAFGITRLNAYAGIASAYILRDAFEINLKNLGLPEFIENSVLRGTTVRELPVVVQDKSFVGPDIDIVDPAWGAHGLDTSPGSLWYAHEYESEVAPPGVPPALSVVPEFFGDTMLVNGTAFPQVSVEPGRYRLRILNACNARFLNLQLYMADKSPNSITLRQNGTPRNRPFVDGTNGLPAVLQIGTEGGFLPRPALVPTNVPFDSERVWPHPRKGEAKRRRGRRTKISCERHVVSQSLLLGPGERADVIVDFSRCRNASVVLYNDAPAPFPMGDPEADFFAGLDNENEANASTPAGFGPNTRVLMRFDVGREVTVRDTPLRIGTRTNLQPGIDPLLVPVGVTELPPGVPVRKLTLNEAFDEYGRLLQLLGTSVDQGGGQFGQPFHNPATETPLVGTSEVWEIYNLSADVHPMHFHLVNVQIINRQPFNSESFDGEAHFTGPVVPPLANEAGWKDTVQMYPGTATRVIMTFDVPTTIPGKDGTLTVPTSPRTGGHEFVWHCHILEHEEHDMMRPLVLI